MSCACYPALKDGYPWVEIVGKVFGDCIYTPREWLSFGIGLLTLGLNVVSLLPQIYLNYKNQKTEGLSMGLLIIWIVADLTALIGSYLTDQLITQKILAIYFLLVDGVTILQCLYYGTSNDTETHGNGISRHNSSDSCRDAPGTYQSEIPLEQYKPRTINTNNNNSNNNNSATTHESTTAESFNTSYQAGLTFGNDNQNDATADVDALLATDDNDDDVGLGLNNNEYTALLQSNQQAAAAPTNTTSPIKSTTTTTTTTTKPSSKKVSKTAVGSSLALVSMFSLCAMIAMTEHTRPVTERPAVINTIVDTVKHTLPNCAYMPELSESVVFIGVLISWISGFLYCASRIPQILSNKQLADLNIPLDGLSPSVFAITALGNVGYGASVLLRVQIDQEFWYKTFPYLLGSLGTILFDVVILTQIHIYNKRYNENVKYSLGRFQEDEY